MFTQTHTRIFCFFLLCINYCYPTTNCQAQNAFGPQQIISTNANGANSIYAIDLDGDGDNDVLSAFIDGNKIVWYINNGNGNFSSEQIISTNASYAASVYAIDIDNDGDNDVLSASQNDDKIAWYINDGSGDFSTEQIISTSANNAYAVYAIDIDDDGDNDVLSASSFDNKIAWYINDGNGNFSSEQIISTNAISATSVYAIDIDGDGDNDVLSASRNDNKIAWYINDGSGNFSSEQIISANADGATFVYAIDIDDDGDNDVLSASLFDNKIAWYINDGSGNFGTEQIISTNANGAYSVYAIDVDGDGDNDVLSASWLDDKIAWYINDGSGNFSAEQIISTNANYAVFVFAIDIDGDGDSDVLSASYIDSKIAWYENLIALGLHVSPNNPPCVGSNTGSLQVQLSGLAYPPYTYTWAIEGSGNTGSGSSNTENFVIDSLAAGTYTLTVINATADTATQTGIVLTSIPGSIFEVLNITSTNSSNSLPNGAILISVAGGVANYSFTWSGMQSGSGVVDSNSYLIPNLLAGNYTITVTDGVGNEVTHTVTLLDETTPGNTCLAPLDIVILNDVSGSVDGVEYEESKQFYVNFINALNVGMGAEDTRVGIVEWSDEAQTVIPITGNLSALQNYAVNNRTFEDGTYPNGALTYGYNYLNTEQRAGVPKVLVLSTDASSDQVSGSLIALAETYKAQGYIIVSIAFDDAFSNDYTRDILRQVASIDVLAPGAPAYSLLTNTLASNIVNLYVCPSDPGSSNTVYFNRDGVLDLTAYTANDFCPTPSFVTINYTVTAQQQLSIPAGTPISFYYNNPALFAATPILTTYIPCAIAAGSSENLSVTLPITNAANVWGVLNDNGTQLPPISFPITGINENVYSNNTDNISICTDPLPTLSALKYTTTPQPICGNTVIYTVDVCNISSVDAVGVTITDQPPAGFALINSNVNYNGCSSGVGAYNIPVGCCVSITYEYDATLASNGNYNNQGVLLGGTGGQIYQNFNAASTTAEDVTIGNGIDCASSAVLFTQAVNTTNVCEEGFITYTFSIENQTNTALQNLSFASLLPAPAIWAAEPYLTNGLSIASTNITGNQAANFTIAEVQPNTTATFMLDVYLGNWTDSGSIINTATLDNLPAFINDNGNAISSTAQTVIINALPYINATNLITIYANETANLSAEATTGSLINWTTTGTGTLDNATILSPTYTTSTADIAQGYVQFTVAATSPLNNCGQDIDTLRLNILPAEEPVAVSLISFNGKQQSKGNLLYWLSSNEQNNDYFTLQSSSNGANFTSIAKINGAGNSNTTKSYQYLDATATQAPTYYRLLQTDYNGVQHQIGTISVGKNEVQSPITLNTSTPNTLQIQYNAPQTQPTTLQLYDIMGKLVTQQTFDATKGINTWQMPVGMYPAGVYLLQVSNTNSKETVKWIKE
jgi:uncharacterized repeat protein (TIGR01451 family)